MKITVGKEEEQWLDSEDLENFPCEDLRIINQLWLSNSGGKFGFSVQKEIYESLGSRKQFGLDFFERLGDRVGWRKDENWVSYSNLYDMTLEEAKQGYLPTPPNFLSYELIQIAEQMGTVETAVDARWELSFRSPSWSELLSREDL